MKIKNKKMVGRVFLLAIFFAGMAAFLTLDVAQAGNSAAIPCICKATADSSVRTATTYFATAADCDQNCANKYGVNAVFVLGLDGGEYKPVTKAGGGEVNTVHTCSCSSSGIYDNAITGTFAVTDEEGCLAQCRGSSSKIYQYDTNAWKDVPPEGQIAAQTKKFEYKLLEAFPGFFQAGQVMTDLPKMVVSIYKFGIWTVGIAGMFMLVVGGFMYMASAGNTSSASSARGIITDALVGIVAALGAYLFLYVINPDLTKISLKFTPVEVSEVDMMPSGGAILTEGRLTDAVARQNLAAAGITVNKANCSTPQATNCTSLDGIPAIAISNLIALKNACKQFNSSCAFVITGGTEAGHKSHGAGNPMLDIRESTVVNSFLKDTKAKKQYTSFGIGQVCTVSQQNLGSISYNHAYDKTCQDPSSTAHFHFSFGG